MVRKREAILQDWNRPDGNIELSYSMWSTGLLLESWFLQTNLILFSGCQRLEVKHVVNNEQCKWSVNPQTPALPWFPSDVESFITAFSKVQQTLITSTPGWEVPMQQPGIIMQLYLWQPLLCHHRFIQADLHASHEGRYLPSFQFLSKYAVNCLSVWKAAFKQQMAEVRPQLQQQVTA